MAKSPTEEILAWKERRGLPFLAHIESDLKLLRDDWQKATSISASFAQLTPIRIVTFIEVFVREAIAQIVDFGSPYLERAEELAKGTRIDFTFLAGLQGRKLTVGDLVAQTVSTNDPGRIISYFQILDPEFRSRLQKSHPRWSEETSRWPLKPIITDFDEMMRNLARLFTVRHILTHELPRAEFFDPSEIDGFFKAAIEFINATEWVLVEISKGHVPRTQTGMNIDAGRAVEELEGEMNRLILAAQERGEFDPSLIDVSQAAWEKYAATEAECHASLFRGGTIYPTVLAGARAHEISKRIETLRWYVERTESDI